MKPPEPPADLVRLRRVVKPPPEVRQAPRPWRRASSHPIRLTEDGIPTRRVRKALARMARVEARYR